LKDWIVLTSFIPGRLVVLILQMEQ